MKLNNLLCCFAIVLIGCSSEGQSVLPHETTGTPVVLPDNTVTDVNWKLDNYSLQYDNPQIVLQDSEYSFMLDSETSTVVGILDCNAFSSTFATIENELRFGSLEMDQGVCDNQNDQRYQDQLKIVLELFSNEIFMFKTDSELLLKNTEDEKFRFL